MKEATRRGSEILDIFSKTAGEDDVLALKMPDGVVRRRVAAFAWVTERTPSSENRVCSSIRTVRDPSRSMREMVRGIEAELVDVSLGVPLGALNAGTRIPQASEERLMCPDDFAVPLSVSASEASSGRMTERPVATPFWKNSRSETRWAALLKGVTPSPMTDSMRVSSENWASATSGLASAKRRASTNRPIKRVDVISEASRFGQR